MTGAIFVFAMLLQAKIEKVEKLDCDSAQKQGDMNHCALRDWRAADKKINQQYQRYLQALRLADRERLKKSQRAWVVYRDAHCDASAALYDGGSMQPLIQYSCLAQLTEQRTKAIQDTYIDLFH